MAAHRGSVGARALRRAGDGGRRPPLGPAQRRPQSDRGTDQPRPSPGEDVMTMSSTEATKLIEDAVREQVEQELRDWEGDELADVPQRARPRASRRTSTSPGSRLPVKRVYTPADLADTPWEDIGLPGRYPFTRGPYPDDVPRPPLDDAPDRRLRHAGRDQRALPVPDRPGPDRPVGRLRHADADGLRLRRPEERRRGRPRGRGRSTCSRTWTSCSHGIDLETDQRLDDDQPVAPGSCWRCTSPSPRSAGST